MMTHSASAPTALMSGDTPLPGAQIPAEVQMCSLAAVAGDFLSF